MSSRSAALVSRPVAGPSLLVFIASLALLLAVPSAAQNDPCPTPPDTPPITDRDGYMVLFEEAPIHPMELSFHGDELWVANIPDASVSVFSVQAGGTLRQQREIPVGLGPVTIRLRAVPAEPIGEPQEPQQPVMPQQAHQPSLALRPAVAARMQVGPVLDAEEMWVVAHSSNAIYIIDVRTKQVVETIRTVHEPSDLVFSSDLSTAYVSLSASNQVAVIDANTRTVIAPKIEVDSPMPATGAVRVHAEEPRSLLLEDDSDLYVLPFKSGNGTMPDELDLDGDGEVVDVFNLWSFPGLSNSTAPPDRDVLLYNPATPTATGIAVLWRMGTLLFDLERGPNGLYVSTVDLLNDTREHKFDYMMNGFSRHLVTYGTPSLTGLPSALPPTPSTIDLNVNFLPALDQPGDPYRCAVPNEMAFNSDQSLLYVACYETRNTVVIDTATDTVIADLRANPAAAIGTGPRGVTLNQAAGVAYVYNRGDNRVQVFNIPVASGTRSTPVQVVPAGFDITPPEILAGRRLFIDASNSGTGLETCNSCHLDGKLDGLGWDLAEFTGDLPPTVGNPAFPRDDNNIKVTMDLRNIEETPPFHWQGNRDDLVDFNAAFFGLLGGATLTQNDFDDLQAFIFALSYRPNPLQAVDLSTDISPVPLEWFARSSDGSGQLGWGCFSLLDAHDVSIDTTGFPAPNGGFNPNGRVSLSCKECHEMNNASGTNNQMNNDVVGLIAEDATQVRGLADKESDIVFYGGVPVPATGWGFNNSGTSHDVRNFLNFFPAFTNLQKDQTTAFLRQLDNGLAPCTAFAWTLNQGSSGGITPVTNYLIPEVTAGNCELVVRGWRQIGGAQTPIKMLYNQSSGMFDTDITGQGPFTYAQLVTDVAGNNGTYTFVGVPLLSGYRLGRDRDMDLVLDGDEPGGPGNLSNGNPDTDGDGFPDGYELRVGSVPTNPASVPAPGSDLTAPAISGETVGWVESEVARIRWQTDEESPSQVRVVPAGGATPVWTGFESQLKTDHTMVVRGLDPNNSYDIFIDAQDPAPTPNLSTSAVLTGGSGVTTQPHLFQSVHIGNTSLQVLAVLPMTGQYLVQADFTVLDQDDVPVSGALVKALLVDWVPGAANNMAQTGTTGPTNASGVGSVLFVTNVVAGSGGTAEVIVDLSNQAISVIDPALNRLYFHPLDLEFNYWTQLTGL